MKLNRLFCVVAMLILTTGSSLKAAEFSPALEAELNKAGMIDPISAIVILEGPIDIRALDLRLHDTGASLAKRHIEVIQALKYNAESVQPAFREEFETAIKTGEMLGFTAHWVENLFVIRATRQFIEDLRERGDIKYVTENFKAELFEPRRSHPKDGVIDRRPGNPLDSETITPGQNAMRTTEVNRVLGITGQGVLVANLDTGVDGTHPALASRWRGNFAPTAHCWLDVLGGYPTPGDGNGHGTHVMGTITGRAISGADTITVGSAPNARWIACNAINQGVGSELDNDIITAFEWFTDPDGDPLTLDDVPDVIQNSWGVNDGFPGYTECFDYWNAVILNCETAGPVITWSAGNEGPGASTHRSPAIYSMNEYQIFSVGAVNATNYSAPYPIADFSSRGPTQCTPASPDNIKPEISAPGVNVYSSVPGGGYDGTYSGTSMAGPHVAGVVALMRETCPDCDYITIKHAIMSTAIDYGTAGEDNTYGHGFIDAYEAVLAVSNLGRVSGIVDDGTNPLQGARVKITSGTNQALTDVNGEYYLPLQAATYSLEYSKFGYISQTIPGITVVEGDTVYQDVSLAATPQGVLSGTVTSCYGGPAAGATVELLDVPIAPATTNGSGFYSFTIPQGTYNMLASGAGCGEQSANGVVLTAATTQNFTLPSDPRFECSAPDGGGYIACENGDAGGPFYTWYEISPNAAGPGTHTGILDDEDGATVAIPFNFRFYGSDYSSLWVCSNGFVSFNGTSTAYSNGSLPNASVGIGIAPFWDDLSPLGVEHISTYYHSAENAFIIEWYQIPHYNSAATATFQLWLYNIATNPGPNGSSQIRIQYQNLDLSTSATVGVANGTTANQYTFNGANDVNAQGLENLRVISYGGDASEFGTIRGTVTDAASFLPLENVLVSRVGSAQSTSTNSFGSYTMNVPVGTFDFSFALTGYAPVTVSGVAFVDGSLITENVAMIALPVLTPLDEDFEDGAPDWTHNSAIGWTDQWHISTERAFSGTQSAKCGDTGTGTYANHVDARLTSPAVTVPISATLSYVIQIESETSTYYPDSAYDGGILEISDDGVLWVQVTPVPGYTKTFRHCANSSCSNPYSGPMPDLPCFAGTVTAWTSYTADLSAYEGLEVKVRFRFGSDNGTGREGWYVDDVAIQGYGEGFEPPTDLTIYFDDASDNLIFRWTATGAPEYQLFSSPSPDGPFDTSVGSTTSTSLTIPIPTDDNQLHYVVVASNGGALLSAPSNTVGMPRIQNR